MLSVNQKLKLLGYSSGIFVCYTIFGILQEMIFRGRYGDEMSEDGKPGQRFSFSVAFVAVQCIVYTLFAKGVALARDHPKNETHQKFYFLVAFFSVAATVTSNMALKWVPYPTQVIAKASKPIPVMLLSVLIGKKTYAVQKYFFVLTVVVGVALFIFKDKYESKDGEDFLIGSILIGFSLLMDGFTGAFQDRMRASCKPSSMSFMYFVNSWSSAILIVIMSVTGEGRDFLEFAIKYPSIIWQMALIVVVGTFGQVFISEMISNFGSLPLCIVTTTRKFFTVLLSVVVFANELSLRQWIATAIIFSALLLDTVFSKKRKSSQENSQETEVAKISSNLAINIVCMPPNIENKIIV